MVRRKQETLDDLVQSLTAGIERVILRPDSNSYRPHTKQEIFHKSVARGKLYIGGNRSGKTVGGIVEDIWWLLGTHPYRETPKPPIRGRLVCVDFPNGWEKVIKPTFTQWIPQSALIDGSWDSSYNSRTRTLTLANGSFIEFMSYDQDLDAFAGASRHFTHFDEEPPSAIFTECKARHVDTGGSWWISMTPVEGMTWVYDDIYEPSVISKTDPSIHVIQVDMTENTYLSPVEIDSFLSGLGVEERKARKSGEFVQIGGLIFKSFDPDFHIIPKVPMPLKLGKNRLMASVDHGFNNPTSIHWHLVSPEDNVVTFYEHYRSEWTVDQHAKMIKEIEKEIGQPVHQYWCDPAMKQRNAVNGNSIQLEYRNRGVSMLPSNNDVKAGLNRMLDYQRRGKWFITENCNNLIREMRRYRWKTRESKKLQEKHGNYEEPHKKDDHAMDDCRYFFMSMPQLAPTDPVVSNEQRRKEIQAMLKGVTAANITEGLRDFNFERGKGFVQVPVATDEHMGGDW